MDMNNQNLPDGLAYDLRQRYALQLGDLRSRILESRIKRDFQSWFDLLDCLYVEIASKLDSEDKREYSNMVSKSNEVIKKNPLAFSNPNLSGSTDIYSQLRKINLWLNNKMDENEMFGSVSYEVAGGL